MTHTNDIQLIASIVIAIASNEPKRAEELLEKALKEGIPYITLYEAILQIHLFAGYPASLEGLSLLRNIYGDFPHTITPYEVNHFAGRGEELCRRIYTTVYEKMISRIQGFSPDLAQWMIIDGYGKTLSRSGLDINMRELINICILSLGQWKHQCISHVRVALNVGVSIEEIEIAIAQLKIEGKNQAFEFATSLIADFKQ